MIPRTLAEFAARLGGEAFGLGEAMVTGFATDSGSVRPGDLFLAFKGERADGHDFAEAAIAKGAVAALVSRPISGSCVLVPDVLSALARMASGFRDSFDGPVVAITGSAGKTSAKEFVAAAMSPTGAVLKSEGNRNSEYTSPLVWADLSSEHRVAVVEMAMRGFGQIRHLASFSKPTVGLVTNVGFAHMEMVGSREGIANAKGELLEALPDGGTALLWAEDDYLSHLRAKTSVRVRTFGHGPDADCRITRYRAIDWEACEVEGEIAGVTWKAKIPLVGRHAALNAAAAILAADTCGVDVHEAAQALGGVALPPMRMQTLVRKGVHILLDNYNASPPSMVAAIETLADLPVSGKRLAVIGEMRELGEYTEEGHRTVGTALAKNKIDAAILLGPSTRFVAEDAEAGGMPRASLLSAAGLEDVRDFLDRAEAGDAVLIKGSRALELERAL